jgi:hypothetical protein
MSESVTETLNFESNYWDLYPTHEEAYLQSVTRLADGVGVELVLRPGTNDISHYEYAFGDGEFQRSDNGKIAIRFDDNHAPTPQRSSTRIRALSSQGSSDKTYTIDINFYPKEMYAASGQTAPGWVIVQNTDLRLSSTSVDSWILQTPSPEEKTFAGEKWGYLIGEGRSDFEGAMEIGKSLMVDLETHRGIPSDAMKDLTPFEQYERVMAGQDRGWCGNIAGMFSYACNALDIPSRVIGMNHAADQDQAGEGYRVLLAEGHGSTEIFSRDLEQWVWIDLTFYILSAYLGEEGPINMAELYQFLNEPARLRSLNLNVFEPKSGTVSKERALDSSKLGALRNYFKRDQQFHYTHQAEPA